MVQWSSIVNVVNLTLWLLESEKFALVYKEHNMYYLLKKCQFWMWKCDSVSSWVLKGLAWEFERFNKGQKDFNRRLGLALNLDLLTQISTYLTFLKDIFSSRFSCYTTMRFFIKSVETKIVKHICYSYYLIYNFFFCFGFRSLTLSLSLTHTLPLTHTLSN